MILAVNCHLREIVCQPSVYFTLNLFSFPCLYINSFKENNCIPSGTVLQKHPDRRRQEQLQEVM